MVDVVRTSGKKLLVFLLFLLFISASLFFVEPVAPDNGNGTPPIVTGENPANNSVNISTFPLLNVTVDDAEDDFLDAVWCSNSTGQWAVFAQNLNINTSNGTVNIRQVNYNFTNHSTTYYWSVNVTDGLSWTNRTYHFTTVESGMGWKLLNNNTILHMWNRFNHYYFNVSNGMQFTNHYNEYWSHNVMMIGYLTGENITDPDDWNLIYRTDELSGFTKRLRTDNQTYINVTLWKDLTYGGYDFRLAIRYHLGVGDMDLSVTPYVKNIGEDDITQILGFGWEVRDIKIGGIEHNSSIYINQTGYLLNQTPLDERYTNLTRVVENVTIPNTIYTLYRDDQQHQELYLKWNGTQLKNKYLVWVKNRTGQYNAPVTLFIKIGTLNAGQEKYTTMHWLDSPDSVNLLPDGDGDIQQWTPSAAVPHYTLVDDPVHLPDDDSTYVYTNREGDIEDFHHQYDTELNGANITNVRLFARLRSENIFNTVNLGVKVIGMRYADAANPPVPVIWTDFTADWLVNPADSQPWEGSDIVELQSSLLASHIEGGLPPPNINCTQVYFIVTYTPADTDSPEIVVNFAGNLSDSGGPYWRPPGESDVLDEAGEGVWRDGYYTNDSRQSEDWIYINCTITDATGIGNVWLNWLNETTWTNWTYAFSPSGIWWEYNTSGNIQTCEGYNYSFNIVANDTADPVNSNTTWWNKTGLGGGFTRRWVQLNCTQTNISYSPFYFYNTTYASGDRNKEDRLHHDQGPDNTVHDTGYLLSTIPDNTVQFVWCTAFVGYWFDESVCIPSYTANNIYYHFWWSNDGVTFDDVGWNKSRAYTTAYSIDKYSTNSSNNRSSIYYNNSQATVNNSYFLDTNLLTITPTSFTDNDIYELCVKALSPGHPSIVSNRSFTSFVILNVPSNATLNASHADTDSDSLSDWTELYVTYTNPFLADTDNDGINDYWENQAGSDPNNYTETFNVTYIPTIIINFAGNLSDSGGPYWRPPGETTQLTGVWSDGYYTNDSMQSEDWIYINLTVNDTDGVDEVWLHWLNETTWTNNSYQFTNTAGDYWEYNTSGNIQTCAGYNYSFDIWANDTLNNINATAWNKTGIGGGNTRRYVQLGCTPSNISYTPYYFYDAQYGDADKNKYDRLHHDQGPDGSTTETGYLLDDEPTDSVQFRYCSNYVAYWFDESVCAESYNLTNIYYHFWWNDSYPFGPAQMDETGWGKDRTSYAPFMDDYYNATSADDRSTIYYDNGEASYGDLYRLNTHLLSVTETSFTDNDIYELWLKMEDKQTSYPSVISNRSFTSFALFNVPNNATLNASYPDSDSDGRSDWEELYVDYTNPFIADTDNDGVDDIDEYLSGSDPNNYTDTTPNTAPTIIGEIPANGSTGIAVTPALNVTVDDANDNTLDAYWYSNSSGPWVLFGSNLSIDTTGGSVNITQTNTNFSGYLTTYWWSVNATDSSAWTNETYHFTTTDAVTITFISQTPANIRTNTTGYVEIVFNVTTANTPINTSSLLFAHVVNHTINGYSLNWSWRLPASTHQPDKRRSDNRNEDFWFEKFNSTGTGEIGNIGEWGCHDNTTLKLTIEASGSNWTRVNFNATVHHMVPNIWYVDRTDMQEENKTAKILDVTGKNAVRTFYNMTDTCYYDEPLYNNSIHFVYFYYGYDGLPNKVMNVYFANSLYTTGDYRTSPNCELIGSVNMNTAPIYTIRNSTYYQLQFSTNATGWVDGLKLTSNYSLIFDSQYTPASKKYYVYYADSNISHAGHYHDFYNASVTQTTSDTGDTWAGFNGAADVHIKYVNLNDTDNIQYKFYANDTSENEAWSSVYGDLIDVTNYPPSCAGIIKPNGTVDYNVSDVVNITYRWAGDPNHETCWLNITCHDSAHNLIAYIQNRSITDAESRATEEFYYDWDTTGVAAGINYSLNITATDPYDLNCTSTSESFNLSHLLVFDINRTSFAFGVVQNNTMVYSNATQPDTFKIYNNGTCSIDIDVNGTNATASGVTDWNLSSSNGDNQYKMEIYNSSTGWIQINKTADTWYSNMAQSTNITANIRITTPTVFYSGKQMTCTIYMTASIH